MIEPEQIAPVRKSITVQADAARAFRVFTDDMDSWWPRTHHIGKTPMTRVVVEPRTGGRCYTEHEDGTEVDWGTVLAWEPPRRLLMAWQVTHQWGREPNVEKASEVEVRFTQLVDGRTRVDLEHRGFERHGAGAAEMRGAVDAEGGWGGMLGRYAERVEATA